MVGRSLLQAENPGPNPGGATRIEQWDRRRSSGPGPGSETQDLAPELMTLPAHIARIAPVFQHRVRAILNRMDWPHEYPAP
jgi:hypothetical protein